MTVESEDASHMLWVRMVRQSFYGRRSRGIGITVDDEIS
jgi:hypothetical protein